MLNKIDKTPYASSLYKHRIQVNVLIQYVKNLRTIKFKRKYNKINDIPSLTFLVEMRVDQ